MLLELDELDELELDELELELDELELDEEESELDELEDELDVELELGSYVSCIRR